MSRAAAVISEIGAAVPKKTSTIPSAAKKPTKLELANASALIFLALIRDADRAVGGREIKKLLEGSGHGLEHWPHWDSLRDKIKLHPHVRATGSGASLRFRWTEPISSAEALALLTDQPNEPQWLRQAWRDVVAMALVEPANPTLRRAQARQSKIDVARAVAELAIELEEIAHNGADSGQIIKRVRSSAATRDLTPIGVAGEDTGFDPAVHKLQFGTAKPGSAVFVVKPGYTWRYGDSVEIIEHALVAKV